MAQKKNEVAIFKKIPYNLLLTSLMRVYMKGYLLKWLSIVLCMKAVFSPSILKAEVLDHSFDWKKLQGTRLGYYIGSFDPIHVGHEHVINQALASGYVDYVLIYPAPGGDQFKNRSSLSLRQKLIASVYQEHPKVLMSYWTPKELQDTFVARAVNIEIFGMIGSDVVTETFMGPDKERSDKYYRVFMRGIPLSEKHYNDTVGALMALKADSFLVALRADADLSYLDKRIYDRSIYAFIQSTRHSSTEVRKAIQNKQPFEHLLSFPVQALIKQEGLYGFASQVNKPLHDELLEMQAHDQKARDLFDIKVPQKELWQHVQDIDTQNGQRLKTIVSQYGWPGVSLVGLDGASAMWLLVQHQDKDVDFQKECLELLKKAVARHEAAPRDLAYLTDRVRMNEEQPQVYGTQWIQEDGKWGLYNVEDVEKLDERRKQMGLNTINENKKQLQAAYQLGDADFR